MRSVPEIYKKFNKLLKKGTLEIRKIRPEEPASYIPKVPNVIKRNYIELLIDNSDPDIEKRLFNGLAKHFIVVSRNYKTKTFKDNLDKLTSLPVDSNNKIPDNIPDPYMFMYFTCSGEYGIGISFKILQSGTFITDKESFYDTADLRDLSIKKKNKISMLIFSMKYSDSINSIFKEINSCIHLPEKEKETVKKVQKPLKKRSTRRPERQKRP
jgi:hypothetical protein